MLAYVKDCLSLKVNEVLAVLEKRDEVYLYLLSDFVNVCQRGVFLEVVCSLIHVAKFLVVSCMSQLYHISILNLRLRWLVVKSKHVCHENYKIEKYCR